MSSLVQVLSTIGLDSRMQALLSGSHLEGVTVSTEIQGLAELDRALDELPERVARRTLYRAVNDGAEIIRRRCAELAPYAAKTPNSTSPLHLKDAIIKQTRVRGQGVKGASVQCRIGLDTKKGESVFYGRFIEFGWMHVGGKQIPAHPFMRPAFDEMKGRALQEIILSLAIGVESAARSLAKQH